MMLQCVECLQWHRINDAVATGGRILTELEFIGYIDKQIFGKLLHKVSHNTDSAFDTR